VRKSYLALAVTLALSVYSRYSTSEPQVDTSWMRLPADAENGRKITHGPQKKGRRGKVRKW
jgi:hypothetical protein